jgi:hypothetical protein
MSKSRKKRKKFFKKLQKLMRNNNCSLRIESGEMRFCFHKGDFATDEPIGNMFFYDSFVELLGKDEETIR